MHISVKALLFNLCQCWHYDSRIGCKQWKRGRACCSVEKSAWNLEAWSLVFLLVCGYCMQAGLHVGLIQSTTESMVYLELQFNIKKQHLNIFCLCLCYTCSSCGVIIFVGHPSISLLWMQYLRSPLKKFFWMWHRLELNELIRIWSKV